MLGEGSSFLNLLQAILLRDLKILNPSLTFVQFFVVVVVVIVSKVPRSLKHA